MTAEYDAVTALMDWIIDAGNIVILTGAELSFESGLPDAGDLSFNPDIKHFKNSREVRKEYWAKMNEFYPRISSAVPNAAHTAIYELGILFNVSRILTQNTDGLQQKAGSENVLELYSSIHWVTCTQCGKDHSMNEVLSQIEKGADIPKCSVCAGDQLKPPISFPGQPLPHWEIREAWMTLQNCDLLIAVGANLDHEPVASFPFQTMDKGGRVAIISETKGSEDDFVNAVIYGRCTQVLPYIVKELKNKTAVS